MAIKTRGKARFAFSLFMLPKNSVVDGINGNIVSFEQMKNKRKINKNIEKDLLFLEGTIDNMIKVEVPIILADTKEDIIKDLNDLMEYCDINKI